MLHLLDHVADGRERTPGPTGGDGGIETSLGGAAQLLGRVVDPAHGHRGRRVAVEAVDVHRDVEVDDVALEQHAVAGNAVAHAVVHRCAQRLGEA